MWTISGSEIRRRFSTESIDDAFGWSARFVTTLPEWPTMRLDAYASSFSTSASIASLNGIQRIGMSPTAMSGRRRRHGAAAARSVSGCSTRTPSSSPPRHSISAKRDSSTAFDTVLDDGTVVYDERHQYKRPDWTFDS